MKKINGFTITKLSMTGFKCFEDTATFDFGDMTAITASNGQGKSSIADAIAFAFVGTPFFGDRGLDRLQNKNTQEMTVSVDFTCNIGKKHNLTRTRKRDMTAITYDGNNIRQADLNKVFGDKDTFLSILNPLYFINVLGDSGKGLLEKLLPAVKHEDVLAALEPSSQEILAEQKLSSPEAFIKKRRSELKKLEETLIGYRSKKELLTHQREERAVTLNELHSAIDALTDEMSELTSIRDNDQDNERDTIAEEISLAELCKRRDELLSEAKLSSANKVTRETMQEITYKIKAVETSIAVQTVAQYVSTCTTQIAETEAGLKLLYDEHAHLNKTLADTVVGYICPTCATAITAKNIEAVKTDLQRRLSVLTSDGKTAKRALAEIKVQDDTDRHAFEDKKTAALKEENNKLLVLNQRLQEMNVARELDSQDNSEQLSSLEGQIKELKNLLNIGNWTPEQAQQFAELDKAKKGYEAKIEALSNVTDKDYTPLITETEAKIAQLKLLINEAVQYMVKRIELMLNGLTMSNTEIVLTEVIKTTGEVRDCFRFSYDGRDYRCLSLSEKVRAGLDVSLLIQRLSGRKYPIFIDNGESICSFGNVTFSGQTILSRVVKNQELQVTCRNRNREQLKMAA